MYRALIYLDWLGRAPCVRQMAATTFGTKATPKPSVVWDVFEDYEESGLNSLSNGGTGLSSEQDSSRLARRTSHIATFCSKLQTYSVSCPYAKELWA